MASPLGDLFKEGSIGRQFLVWSVAAAIAQQALQPVLTQIADDLWPLIPSQPLSAADAAEMRLKGIMSQADAEAEGKRTGVDAGRMEQLWRNAGEPMSIQEALFALRRGIIPWDAGAGGGPSFMEAVRQSRLRDEWGPTYRDLQWLPLTVSDAVDAVVESQIDYPLGEQEAGYNGVKPDHFKILVNTRGNPPSPTELLEMHRRGFIAMEGTGPDATTVQQGIYEGATKNKWYPHLAQLDAYLPPPRTVTTLLRNGDISQEVALRLFKQAGLSDELAAAYVKSASHEKLQKARELTVTTILDLYEVRAITEKEATDMVEHLGYTAQETAYELRSRDVQRTLKAINAALTRVSALYVARKIDATSAREALDSLGIAREHADELMTIWDLERRKSVKVLTPAQIASAVYYKVLTHEQGVERLVADGYTPADAEVLVDVRLHGIPTTPVAPPA